MPDWLKEWMPFIALVWMAMGTGFIAWVRWSFKQQFATREELQAEARTRREKDQEQALKIERHDEAIDKLPTRDQWHALDKHLTELGGKLDTTNARLDRVDRVADRLEAWHLQGSRQS